MSRRRLPPADRLCRNVDPSIAATWTPIPKSKQGTPTPSRSNEETRKSGSTPCNHDTSTSKVVTYAFPDEELSLSPMTQVPHLSRQSSLKRTSLHRSPSLDRPSKHDANRRKSSASTPLQVVAGEGKDKSVGKKVHWADQSDDSEPEPEPERQPTASSSRRRSSIVFEPSAFSGVHIGPAPGLRTPSDGNVRLTFPEGLITQDLRRSRSSGSVLRAPGPVDSLPIAKETATVVPGQPISTHSMVTRSVVRSDSATLRSCGGRTLSQSAQNPPSSTSGAGKIHTGDARSLRQDLPTCNGYGAELLHDTLSPSSQVECVLPFPEDSDQVEIASQPTLDEVEDAEMRFLRSDLFNPRDLRPVSDLSQIFGTITNVFGEPGTGLLSTRFVPVSSVKTMFQKDETQSSHGMLAKGFLAEGFREQSAAKEKNKAPASRFGELIYGVNPALKSRHLAIQLLKVKIPHRTLLSYNLNRDARRDAVAIGGRSNAATGPIDATAVSRILMRRGSRSRRRERIGSGMFNSRSGNRRRNSDPKAWTIGADGQRKRRRESDHYQDAKERDREMRMRRKINRAVDEGNLKGVQDVTSKERSRIDMERYLPTDWSDLVTWRLIKLSAIVEVDGMKVPRLYGRGNKEETHVSWWAVPEKAIVGMF